MDGVSGMAARKALNVLAALRLLGLVRLTSFIVGQRGFFCFAPRPESRLPASNRLVSPRLPLRAGSLMVTQLMVHPDSIDNLAMASSTVSWPHKYLIRVGNPRRAAIFQGCLRRRLDGLPKRKYRFGLCCLENK